MRRVKQEVIRGLPRRGQRVNYVIVRRRQRRHTSLPSHRSAAHADRVRRSQPGQSPPVRADRARTQDRQEPDRLGLARADRLSQDRRPAGTRAVATAPAAAARSGGGFAPGGRGRHRSRYPRSFRTAAGRPGSAARPARAVLTRTGTPARTLEDRMYPSRFRYEAPRSLGEAIGLLHDGGDDAKVLAGGQSLVPLMKLRFASPELVVDINNLPGLEYHRRDPDGTIRVGALCRHADLEHSELLRAGQPTMAAAAPLIADPIVRNRGTLVGSLCHADPQGDWASVVMSLGGSIVAQGPRGRRAIPLADFVTGPFENVLEADEIA